jgi:hypothetical protein
VTAVALVAGVGQEVVRVERAFSGNIVCVGGLPIAQGTVTDDARAARAADAAHAGVARRRHGAFGAEQQARRPEEAGRRAARADRQRPVARSVVRSDEGELILMGSGELHLDVSLSRLSTLAGFAVERSPPLVPLRETIVGASPRVYLGKSGQQAQPHLRRRRAARARCGARRCTATAPARRRGRQGAPRAAARRRRAGRRPAPRASRRRADNVVIDRCTGVSVAPLVPSLTEAFHALERNGCWRAASSSPASSSSSSTASTTPTRPTARPRRSCRRRRAPSPPRCSARRFASSSRCWPSTSAVPIAALDGVYRVLHARTAVCDAADVSEERGFVAVHARVSARASLGHRRRDAPRDQGRSVPDARQPTAGA